MKLASISMTGKTMKHLSVESGRFFVKGRERKNHLKSRVFQEKRSTFIELQTADVLIIADA